MFDCQTAAAQLCASIGEHFGPLALIGAAQLLALVAMYVKSSKAEKAVRTLQADVAETKALVSVRPTAIDFALEGPSVPPLPIVPPKDGEP